MNETLINAHIGSLEDMGRRFAEAWKAAEPGAMSRAIMLRSSICHRSWPRCLRAGSS